MVTYCKKSTKYSKKNSFIYTKLQIYYMNELKFENVTSKWKTPFRCERCSTLEEFSKERLDKTSNSCRVL